MSTFAKGLAWTVAFLSGVATIFALFGGQQWLEQKGWTLAPSTAQTAEAEPDAQQTASEVAQDETADEGDSAQEPSDEGAGFSWDAVLAWSEGTFDNLLWGIAAIGISMLIAGAAGAAALHATVEATYSPPSTPTARRGACRPRPPCRPPCPSGRGSPRSANLTGP
ncbi:hypothetical protein [Glycomyces niveus]|uniref:Uncharacterized protein n=1 Tax=Glycomyces niveus TaxID=2820287 RepID=A0ABS3U099_9ACTN|nr:hypothetical protein [Glycomyces sp. NEAU-S30]MBO3732188.1 hypothetical protein [Glycomyces sp. NEAU-S30]